MNDKRSSGEDGWADVWTDVQRKYWDAWSEMTRQTMGMEAAKPSEPTSNPWTQSFDLWSKMMAPAMPRESRAWMDRLLDMNKAYLQMGETLYRTFSARQEAGTEVGQWWNVVSQSIAKMQEQVAAGLSGAKDPWGGFATLWGLPLDTWKRLSTACSVMPGDMEKAFRDVGGDKPADFPSMVGQWLSTPTLGYTRESQAELQQLGQLWLEHGQALQSYASVLSHIVARSGELLRDKIMEQAAKGEAFDSLRSCYNIWIDCGEEAYGEISISEEFTRAQAKLTNSLMAVKHQEQKMVDELLGSLNMPTRRELDTSHRRLHQLQRSVWRMQRALDDVGVRELREEVATLQSKVNELTRALAQTAPAAPAPAARRSTKPKNAV